MRVNMSDANKSQRNKDIIFREQVYLLYSVMLNSLIGSVIIASVLSFVQWEIIKHSVLMVWISLTLVVVAFRFVLRFRFKQIDNLSPKVIKKYYYLFLLGVLASGIIWGMASILLFTVDSMVNQVFLAFMIGGITAGAISSLSYRMAPIMIFLVCTLPPLAVRFFHTNTELSWIMGGMISVFFILVAINSRIINKISYKNITLELRVKDQKLLLKESNLRVKAEEDLRKSEKQLQSILDNSSTVVYVKNLEFKYMLINKRYEELFHVTNESIRDKTDYDIFPQQIADRFRENDLTALNTLKPSEFEERAQHDDGMHTYISIKFCLYNNKNEPYAVCGISTDITERKQLEYRLLQAQKMEALGTLAGGIAHEFNNLLGVILGNVQICMMELPESSKERQYLFPILKVGKRAANLVKQILVFSRMKIVDLEPVNLYPVVEDAIQMIRATIPTNIEIRKNFQWNHVNIMADTTQIHQVLLNLSINAYHAMEETSGVLDISLEKAECDQCPLTHCTDKLKTGCLELTVSDTGHGISLEDQEKIFDPFFTTKEVGKGTGLGLAVVHGIINNHQGQITLKSELGKGTTFRIFFPIVTEEAANKKPVKKEMPKQGDGHILIAEDEANLVEIYQKFLEKLGYCVTVCDNGFDALKIFMENPARFDLVLTDQAMPNMTGKHLSQELLKIRSDIPIILSTGHSEVISDEETRLLGIRRYLMKPVELERLQEVIEECLNDQ